jgi:serine protease Do
VKRGTIGYIQVLPLTPQLANELSSPDTQGLAIAGIGRNAIAAYKAGLRVGDVVKSFNGTAVTDAGQLYRLISDAPIGSTATLGLLRDGKGLSIKVPIERPASR